ncbi:hypothetical protein IV203_006122 [Nitzschia inconspicua]|uniref:Uncharacterized protein n=1 Tax=Nitzschia inconspicua TaxID=303405 RepID=A0A9K3PH10_9STRA|nr:hypothetical protein IV203_006122 [Nitzschia inconspicua]
MAINKNDWRAPAPYGGTGWMYLFIQFLAFLFFFFASFTCWLTVSQTTELKVLIGYWSRELPEYAEAAALAGTNRNYCVAWDSATKEQLFDGPWRFGRAVGVIGAILAIPVFLISLCITLVSLNMIYFKALCCTHILMGLLSTSLLAGLGSDVCEVESCRLGPGGYLAIVDTFLWMAAAIGAYILSLWRQESEPPKTDAKPKVVPAKLRQTVVSTGNNPSISETENEEMPVSQSRKKKVQSTAKSKKKKITGKKSFQEP